MLVVTKAGFTIVELIVIIVVIGILAGVSIVGYGEYQQSIAKKTIQSDLLQARSAMKTRMSFTNTYPTNLNDLKKNFTPSPDTNLVLLRKGEVGAYSNLSTVQQAVLFHETCRQIFTEPQYQTLYSHDKSQTNTSYNIWCGSSDGVNGINAGSYQINSWNSTTWQMPITEAQIQNRIDNPPTHSWWDTATLDSSTYRELLNRYKARGGTFPITSAWDSWASCGGWGCSGVPKEPLPPTPPTFTAADYCLQATSKKYPSISFHIFPTGSTVSGSCPT